MHRIMKSINIFDIVIPIMIFLISLHWLETNKAWFQAAETGEHWNRAVKTSANDQAMQRAPTTRVACLKAGLLKIRRYSSKIDIFTRVMVRP